MATSFSTGRSKGCNLAVVSILFRLITGQLAEEELYTKEVQWLRLPVEAMRISPKVMIIAEEAIAVSDGCGTTYHHQGRC
jgi:hypothetical protein